MTFNQPVDWEEIQLGELFTAHYGKSLTQKNRVPGKYKVYGSSGITGTHNEFLVKGPGLIIGRKGTIGNVYYEKNCFYPIDTTYYVKESNRYDLLFLYYKLKTLDLDKMNTHSAVPGLNREQLYSIKTKFPIITEQKAIANILSTLDEKIETNNQINEKLEEMAQALFKRWFVDFEFPNENGEPYKSSDGEMVESELGMIPKGWKIEKIGDIADIQNGYAFKASEYVEKGVRVLRTLNINDKGYFDNQNIVYLPSNYNNKKFEKYFFEKYDLALVMVGASIGKTGIILENTKGALQNQNMWRFRTKRNDIPQLFLINVVKQAQKISQNWSTGSAREFYRKDSFSKIKVLIPNNILLERYNSLVFPIFEKISFNTQENDRLMSIRDSLLPKLMSGEIRVPLDDEVLSEKN